MPRLLISGCIVLATLFAVPSLARGSDLAGEAGGAIFGSEVLLRGLWSPAELAASERDRNPVWPGGAPPEPLAEPPVLAPLPPEPRGVVRRVEVPEGRKVAALTFDLCELADAPSGYDADLVDFLRANDVRATVFAGGKWLLSHPQKAMQLLADPRFEIGDHALTHGNLGVMDEAEIRAQVLGAAAAYATIRSELARRAEAAGLGAEMAAVPPAMRLFRFPYGRTSPLALSLVGQLGFTAVQWDGQGEANETVLSPEALAKQALRAIGPGSIMLLHANAAPKKTAALVRLLVPALRERGYELVTVSQLLAMGRPEYAAEGYFRIPGDNAALDRWPGKGTLRMRRPR